MKCLVTGGSGFLGRYVVAMLKASGNNVHILGRTSSSDIAADLATGPPSLASPYYDVVYHIAGKAHFVPQTDAHRLAFTNVNSVGTVHLLRAIEQQDHLPGSLVLISSVAVYGREDGCMLDENSPLSAEDPYGSSKRHAEEYVLSWGRDHGVTIGIVRLPLVAGKHPPGNLGRMIESIRQNRYFGIGGGGARRSVVLATDVAAVLPVVAEKGGIYNLTDGLHPSFRQIENAIASVLEKRPPPHLPKAVAEVGARFGDAIMSVTSWRPPLTT